ncbi:MAG: ROK family protein [Saprospiraceae bacterium]|nr:MAG: ROK family protein [Saprospiraceae bacterium]
MRQHTYPNTGNYMQTKTIFGIDVGGTNTKGAIVDLGKGELISERIKVPTPVPSKPEAVAKVVAELVRQAGYKGKLIGCGFPSIVKDGVCHSAANIDAEWKGVNINKLFSKIIGAKVITTNDADAAGLAEMRYGKGKNVKGNVLLVTIGTGLGTALFTDGILVPNTEFGHCTLHNMIAEHYVSGTARKAENMTWKEFGNRFNEFLEMVNRLTSPNLIILGGGISNFYRQFRKYLTVDTRVKAAKMFNHAGIIGAALYAYEKKAGKL